jgi:hypothetical protein
MNIYQLTANLKRFLGKNLKMGRLKHKVQLNYFMISFFHALKLAFYSSKLSGFVSQLGINYKSKYININNYSLLIYENYD